MPHSPRSPVSDAPATVSSTRARWKPGVWRKLSDSRLTVPVPKISQGTQAGSVPPAWAERQITCPNVGEAGLGSVITSSARPRRLTEKSLENVSAKLVRPYW